MSTQRITANAAGRTVRIYAGTITAQAASRTLGGMVVRYGVPGRTSAGLLRVRPGALRFPEDLTRVKLTREHNRDESRGHLVALEHTPDGIRAQLRVSDGAAGDDALREAADRTRDGFSYDVVDAQVVGDELTSALVIAIGQVGIPAYEDSRIDTIAAHHPTTPGGTMTAEQRARLAELRAKATRTTAEEAELSQLATLEAAHPETPQAQPPAPATTANAPPAAPAAPAPQPVAVAASIPAVPAGLPQAHTGQAQVDEPNPLARMITGVTAGIAAGDPAAVTAALNDITNSEHRSIIDTPAWSGELWSGLQYEPIWSNLYNTGPLTALSGRGWRFKVKPEIKDYAGDKAEIPTSDVETEDSTYAVSRMAVGHDVDRAFFDFPVEGFLQGLLEAVRESWAIKLDDKVRAYTLANAVPVAGPASTQPTLLKAAGRAIRELKRRKVGKATFVAVNEDDFFGLLDYTKNDVPAFLELFGIKPEQLIPDVLVPAGTVIAGAKPAATVRTLPGSPIRVEAQNLTRAGIDQAFFGYWAIEEHHTSGLASVQYVEDETP